MCRSALDVLTRRVVDAGDGWLAAECGVAAVVVAGVQEVLQGGGAFGVALAVDLAVEMWWPAPASTAVSAVPLLVLLLRNRVADAASSRVSAESARAVCLVRDHMAGSATWPAPSGAGHPDAFEQGACADAVVVLPGAAVAGVVDFGGQPASRSATPARVGEPGCRTAARLRGALRGRSTAGAGEVPFLRALQEGEQHESRRDRIVRMFDSRQLAATWHHEA